MEYSLDGEWDLYYGPGSISVRDIQDANQKLKKAIARVPGETLLDLQRAGEIPDPYFGDNFLLLRRYEDYQWWYHKDFEFDQPGLEGVDLVFHGIQGIAEVFLNGERLGRCENSFIEHRFDVSGKLKELNSLVVKFEPPLDWAARKAYDAMTLSWEGREEALWLRVPQHAFGWDIAPRIVSNGIWKGVDLQKRREGIEELYFATTEANEESATLEVYYRLSQSLVSRVPLTLRITLNPRRDATAPPKSFENLIEFVAGHLRLEVNKPLLWWPKGYGDANLYDAKCDLFEGNKLIDSKEVKIGIRTVRLERSTQKGVFRFLINGRPIRFRGANWTPLDAFHSRDANRLADVLSLYDDLGCNIIRCWGGGVYESEEFFDFCDEHGIAVWQDFAMACARYPQHEEFRRAIEEEAVQVVRRLRNHPSLLLWAGDNECDLAYAAENLSPSDNRLTREVLPAVCKKNDPHRPYIPSSPYVSEGLSLTDLPEQHLWGPRDYFKSDYYTKNKASFISEIGYHGCPNPDSLARFIPSDSLWPPDDRFWRAHSVEHWLGKRREYSRIKLMVDQERVFFGEVPDKLEDFALASQITQAEALKFFIERARLSDKIWGIIWWNVIDPWPQISDSVVDYYFKKKLAYHFIKKAQRPFTIAMTEPSGWTVSAVAINDTLVQVRGSYEVEVPGEGTLAKGTFSVGPASREVLSTLTVVPSEKKLFLISWEIEGKKFTNHYLMGQPPFDLNQYRQWLSYISPFTDDPTRRLTSSPP